SPTLAIGPDRYSATPPTPPRRDICLAGRPRLVSRLGFSAPSTGTLPIAHGGRSSCGCARFPSLRRRGSASCIERVRQDLPSAPVGRQVAQEVDVNVFISDAAVLPEQPFEAEPR